MGKAVSVKKLSAEQLAFLQGLEVESVVEYEISPGKREYYSVVKLLPGGKGCEISPLDGGDSIDRLSSMP
jgi:hypothetical protein